MGKFDKREICMYCEQKMEAKYRNKKFCSNKCRVYWNRENIKEQTIPTDTNTSIGSSYQSIRLSQKLKS